MPFLKRNDIDVYYEVHGQGTPVMFFSETACDGEVWKIFQVPEFSRDHMVITHDYRDTRKSIKPPKQYSTEDFVDNAVAILDHMKAGDHLRHSMGRRVI